MGRLLKSKWNFLVKGIATILVLLAFPACSEKGKMGAQQQRVLQVDNHVMTLQEFNNFFELVKMNYGKEDALSLREARLRYLLQLLEEMLIVRRAEELNIAIPPEELAMAVSEAKQDYPDGGFQDMLMKQAVSLETWTAGLKKQLLVKKVIVQDVEKNISVSPEEIRQYFDDHQGEWHRKKSVHVLHILLSDKQQAVKILDRIKKGQDFAKLAREHSTAPEAERGGDMGFVERGGLPEDLEHPIFTLRSGEVSPIIESAFGYHLFKVVGKRPAGKPTKDDLIEEIRERVKREKIQLAYGPWLAKLRARYDVRVNKDIIQAATTSGGMEKAS